nr:MAG TPA: Lamin-B receptor BINDING PROTEIN [Caudoviricetes sp.]
MQVGDIVYFKSRDEEKIIPGTIIKANELEITVQYIDFKEPHIIEEIVNKPLKYKGKTYVNRQKDISILDIKNNLIELFLVHSISPIN